MPDAQIQTHTCAVAGCTTEISTALLMCTPHWYRVPRTLKNRVNRAWMAVCQGGPNAAAAREQHRVWKQAAIDHVNDLIGAGRQVAP